VYFETAKHRDKLFDEAMKNEFYRGMEVAAASGALDGAQGFTKGQGKHGQF